MEINCKSSSLMVIFTNSKNFHLLYALKARRRLQHYYALEKTICTGNLIHTVAKKNEVIISAA